MNHIFIIFISLLLSACASKKEQTDRLVSAPAPIVVSTNIDRAIETAIRSAEKIKDKETLGKQEITELSEEITKTKFILTDAQLALAEYSKKVDEIGEKLNTALIEKQKAEERALYWQEKQHKALRELWLWRSAAIAVIALIALYFGIRIYGRSLLPFKL